MNPEPENFLSQHRFVFEMTIENLSETVIHKHAFSALFFDSQDINHIVPESIELNQGVFGNKVASLNFPSVSIIQTENQLTLFCNCGTETNGLCEHQSLVLVSILRKDELYIFFNQTLRNEKLKKFAADYGLENNDHLDDYFQIEYSLGKIHITPRLPTLVPVTKDSLKSMHDLLIQDFSDNKPFHHDPDEIVSVVLKQHKHYKYLQIELFRSPATKEGKIKNPMEIVSPLDLVWQTDDIQQLKFFTGIHKFQGHPDTKRTESDLAALRAIVQNPLDYPFYCHDEQKSEKINASSVFPVKTALLSHQFTLTVDRKNDFFEVDGKMTIGENSFDLQDLSVKFTYFILAGDTLFLADQLPVLAMLDLLKRKQDKLLIHSSKFWDFKTEVLKKLEEKIQIDYLYIQPATKIQLEENSFTQETEKLIYLSDFGSHVMIIPVMRYGDMEIQVHSKKQLYAIDPKKTVPGSNFRSEFLIQRDSAAEVQFTMEIIRQHPYFEEQQDNDLQYYYLHKKHFLDEDWFLNAFETWQNRNITILGFNELEGNRFNPEKPKIDIKVLSGINWFNAEVDVKFGQKKASLKHLHKAIRNKSKYVKLDDGTLGILPEAWIEKFSRYFNSGEIIDLKTLQIPKISFTEIETLFDAEMLDSNVKAELKAYREKFAQFETIEEVKVPKVLKAKLRPYQQEGLNWLNFLDDFNFGGCLADDMGLGKSIQIIAFILSQRKKTKRNVNLLVVPATLIFNWQQEVMKFAPSIQILTLHGSERPKSTIDFEHFEIILTSYGTLLSDVHFLKEYTFNYIFLDESQNIRNPETERYKAVRLLKSRNQIAITGTPVENNTFDLYSQFSFACPGLLGSKQYFRDVYAVPIDQFKESKRATELQNKIKPFMLRRTKQQVATELPEKTEMVLYCQMAEDQRKMYDAYEKEFRDYISATTNEDLNKNSMNVLRGLTRLRQICDAPILADELSEGISSAKINLLIEEIENKSPQHKILVFSQFVTMLDLIQKALQAKGIKQVKLTGQTKNRKAVVDEFQENDEVKVFLISLKAGGTGLNLTKADYVYLVDPWWNPAVENQAIDRAHRIGQDKKVIAVRLICPNTLEEKILQLQETKRELADELIPSDVSFLKSLSKANLLDLLSDLK